jgi:hypothetical protein
LISSKTITLDFYKSTIFSIRFYWLSAILLLFIILFGWLGALGLFIGGIFTREFSIEATIALGLISELTPLLAFSLWN